MSYIYSCVEQLVDVLEIIRGGGVEKNNNFAQEC